MRKPFFWAAHTSFSMERGLHKAVLFGLPTHSEGFLCFGRLLPPPPPPNTQPIFLFLALLLLCPASFFGLFAGCSRAQTPTSQHRNSLSLKPACSPQERTLTSAPAGDRELLQTDPETLGFWQQREPQGGEVRGSPFSLCQQQLTPPWFYSTGI